MGLTLFVCCFSGIPILGCPTFDVLKIVVSYFFFSVFPLIVSGGGVNLVPVTPSWPAVDVECVDL